MPLGQESKVTIKIPRALYRRLKEILDGSGFDSVTDFIVYVLRDIASSKGIKSTQQSTCQFSLGEASP